jgi:hypothetical protein
VIRYSAPVEELKLRKRSLFNSSLKKLNYYVAIQLLLSTWVVSLTCTFSNSIPHCASVIAESKLLLEEESVASSPQHESKRTIELKQLQI